MKKNHVTLKEKCGVFGIYDVEEAAKLSVLGLHSLQHRGQEGAGIVSCDGKKFYSHNVNGHVGDGFSRPSIVNRLKGRVSIGHVRYSTSGSKSATCAQPITANLEIGEFSIAHNGNLTNAETLKKQLIKEGSIFQSPMDTEVIMHLVAKSQKESTIDRIVDALKKVKGAYSIVAMDKGSIYAIRDPFGVRPLQLGQLGDSFVVASETCAFDIIGAKYIRDVEPGEMLQINAEGVKSFKPFESKPSKFCIFEYIYFARPDSTVNDAHVYNVRKNIGLELARESSVKADMVVPVPDSGVPAALGFAEECGIKFELGIIRNHYVGRTFIEPTDNVRHLGVKLKHNANGAMLKNKSVVLVDDSIVRGTTSKKIVQMVREAGAKEVHMRIASPPTTSSCFYGVDTPEKSKLMASNYTIEAMCKEIGADSLSFISLDGLYKAVSGVKRDSNEPQYCDACFTGNYPIELVDDKIKKLAS